MLYTSVQKAHNGCGNCICVNYNGPRSVTNTWDTICAGGPNSNLVSTVENSPAPHTAYTYFKVQGAQFGLIEWSVHRAGVDGKV